MILDQIDVINRQRLMDWHQRLSQAGTTAFVLVGIGHGLPRRAPMGETHVCYPDNVTEGEVALILRNLSDDLQALQDEKDAK